MAKPVTVESVNAVLASVSTYRAYQAAKRLAARLDRSVQLDVVDGFIAARARISE